MVDEWHLAALSDAATALAERAAVAGFTARVPTCPRWTVADLVAHQGMVHRWAASNLRLDDARIPSKSEILRTVPRDELLAWYADGVAALLETFATTRYDVAAMVFLNNAPAPRTFWARRQAHETTIHAADALAAALGRIPTEHDAGLDPDLAVDGIDELLRGFFTRGRTRLFDGAEFTVAVRPSDAGSGWLLRVRPTGLAAERVPVDDLPDADALFTGTAVQLYLGLWNRGTEIRVAGRESVLERWREVQRVQWS